MFVVKRKGNKEPVNFDKITSRIRKLAWGLSNTIDPILVAKKVIKGVYNGVRTTDLDELAAQTAASMITNHPDYGLLAARIEVSNLHKNTKKNFSDVIEILHNNKPTPMIDKKFYDIVSKNKKKLNSTVIYDRDYQYDYFGIKTLMKSYLFKINGIIIERPQHLLMRVSLGIHGNDIKSVIETYNLMSLKYFTHASPTLFNAATPKPQLSSCFLLTIKDDSIEGIYDTVKQCAVISKHAGGIGLSIHCVRGKGSLVSSTNGSANGIIPMLRVFNDTARYIDQGGKRKGSFAIYLEPWHCDIFSFLALRKNNGKEEQRCRDLFLSLWIPDLFMKRVENDELWSLFCPNKCKNLDNLYGDKFEELYEFYETNKLFAKQIKARDLWSAILYAQMETGQPFVMYKDHCNKKSNQKNLGIIKSGNLCTEIVEYANEDEIAVCNLASIALPKFVNVDQQKFDFNKLMNVTSVITKNLNKIIDINYYPLVECKTSNLRHRPIGIGVQGLADAFLLLRLPFDSDKAKKLNKDIFECIYYAACKTSNELAIKYGPYETFNGCPASKGLLSFDLWNLDNNKLNKKYPWNELKQNIIKHGLRNSLLTAPMPTATTSQILGNNECFEPYTSNVYLRRTLAGEYIVINKHLLIDLISLGIWSKKLKNQIIAHNGSVQDIDEVPNNLKILYRTVWEIKQKEIINMAADRAPFIDQSQSLNIHMQNVSYAKLTSMHFYGWKKGLKTGMYYLRTKAAVDPIKFTISPKQMQQIKIRKEIETKINKELLKPIKNTKTVNIGKNKKINGDGDNKDDHKDIDHDDDYKDDTHLDEKNKINGNNNHNDDVYIMRKNNKRAMRNMNMNNKDRKRMKMTYMCSRENKDECMMCGS